MKKVEAVDAAIRYTGPAGARVALYESTATEKSQALGDVFIPQFLTPALLTGVRSPREAWSILHNRAKKYEYRKYARPCGHD